MGRELDSSCTHSSKSLSASSKAIDECFLFCAMVMVNSFHNFSCEEGSQVCIVLDSDPITNQSALLLASNAPLEVRET